MTQKQLGAPGEQEIKGMNKCAKISVSSASPLQAQGEDGVHPSCNRARSGEDSGTGRCSVGGLIHINTDNNSRSHLYLQLNHQLIDHIWFMSLYCEGKTEYLEKTHTGLGRTCKLYTQKTRLGFKPNPFLEQRLPNLMLPTKVLWCRQRILSSGFRDNHICV